MPRSRLSVAMYLALVFASGILVGGFAHRLYQARSVAAVSQSRSNPEEWRKRYVNELRERVKLDDQQVDALHGILDETRQRYHELRDEEKKRAQAIHAAQTEKIRAMLREDQRPAYEELRAERERRRQEYEKKQKGPRPPR